jgi:hypothetical protein
MKEVTDFIPLGNGSGIVKAKASHQFCRRTLADTDSVQGLKAVRWVLMITAR